MVLFFLGDRVLACLGDRAIEQSRARVPLAYTGRMPTDLLIVGNSRAKQCFDNELISQHVNARVSNLGVNGMGGELLESLVADYLDKHPTPRLILVEASLYFDGWDHAMARQFLCFAKFGSHTNDLLKRRMTAEWVACQLFELRRFSDEEFWRSLAFMSRDDQVWSMSGTIDPLVVERTSSGGQISMRIDPASLHSARRLVKRVTDAGAEIRFVIAPYLPEQAKRMKGYASALGELERVTSRPVLDMSKSLDEASMFADTVHTNRRGQIQFTKNLLNTARFESIDQPLGRRTKKKSSL